MVGQTCGQNMKSSISLEKERIKLKGNGQKVIVPIHPFQGEPWIEPVDEEVDVRHFTKYKIMKTILSQTSMGNFIWGTKIQLDII